MQSAFNFFVSLVAMSRSTSSSSGAASSSSNQRSRTSSRQPTNDEEPIKGDERYKKKNLKLKKKIEKKKEEDDKSVKMAIEMITKDNPDLAKLLTKEPPRKMKDLRAVKMKYDYDRLMDKHAKLEKKDQDQQKEIEDLTNKLDNMTKAHDALNNNLEQKINECKKLTDDYHDLQRELDGLQALRRDVEKFRPASLSQAAFGTPTAATASTTVSPVAGSRQQRMPSVLSNLFQAWLFQQQHAKKSSQQEFNQHVS